MKTIYIYIAGFIAVILVILIFTQLNNESSNSNSNKEQLPNDAIHQGLSDNSSETPSSANLRSDVVQRMSDMKKKIEDDPSDTLSIKEYADLISAGHREQEAIELYKKILEIDSKRIDILTRLTYINYNMGNIAESEQFNNNILSAEPNNHFANYNLGAIYIAKGDTLKAKAIWNQIQLKFPNSEVAGFAKSAIDRLGTN